MPQLELARVGTHSAAWCSQVDDPLPEHSAAAGKAFVAEAAVMVTGENIQVHGGVGFTWDLDFTCCSGVKQNDVLFGTQGWNRARRPIWCSGRLSLAVGPPGGDRAAPA